MTASSERSFAPPVELTVEGGPRTIVAGDLNGDGKIPQESAAMGVLVNRAFLHETANGVVFTADPTNPRGACYLVTAQPFEESVVSPDPGVFAEVDILEVAAGEVRRITRAQRSSLLPPGAVVLTDEELEELGALIWHIDENYPLDPEGHERGRILLDLEFKREPDGSLAVKQVRPFLPAGDPKPQPEKANGGDLPSPPPPPKKKNENRRCSLRASVSL